MRKGISFQRPVHRACLVLPATTERFVKSDDGEQLIAPSAGQIQLGREELLLRFENLVIAGFAGDVSLGGKLAPPVPARSTW